MSGSPSPWSSTWRSAPSAVMVFVTTAIEFSGRYAGSPRGGLLDDPTGAVTYDTKADA